MRLLILAAFLWIAAGCAGPPEPARTTVPQTASEVWYIAHLAGQPVGYLRKISSPLQDGGRRLYSENFLAAKMLDKPFRLRAIETLDVSSDFKPEKYFQTIDAGMGRPFRVRGTRREDKFHVEVESSGNIIKQQTFSLTDITFPQLADLSIRPEDLKVGKTWTFNVINPNDFLPIRMTVSVDKIVPFEWRGHSKQVFQVTARMGAIEMVSYVDTVQEEPYRIETPAMDLAYVLEDETAALKISGDATADLDLAYFAAVVSTGGAMPPEPVDQIRLRISGASFEDLQIAGDYQRVERFGPAGAVLDIRRPGAGEMRDIPPELMADGIAAASNPSDTAILTADIRKLAEKLHGPTPLAFCKAAVDWMQENIRQVPTSIVPTAADVLEIRQGDCNEFSALFHALALAANFPCRIVTGLVHDDGRFLYHSWNEIRVGRRWIPVDPIFGEIPASPKHVKLIEGDYSSAWRLAGLLRRLKIEILPNNT